MLSFCLWKPTSVPVCSPVLSSHSWVSPWVHADCTNKCNGVKSNYMTLIKEINIDYFHKTVLLAFLSLPLSVSLSLSTNSNTLCCTKWMGLLCWSLFSSFESYSSLTSTTFMEGMSFFPSLLCCLTQLGSVTRTATWSVSWIVDIRHRNDVSWCFLCLDPGTHLSPSTWFPSRCRGIVTSVLLCSWHPSSTGSPLSAGVPCDYSRAPPALRDRVWPQPLLRNVKRMAAHCHSPPTATARAQQSPSWPLTEESEVEGGGLVKGGRRMYQWVCKKEGKQWGKSKTWKKLRCWPQIMLKCL